MAWPFRHRRPLEFHDLTEVPREVRRVMDRHKTTGRWTLAQICRHLADTIARSIDGFDLRRHRIKRRWLGKLLLAVTYRFGIPPGYTIDPNLTPPEGVDLKDSLAALDRAVARYQAHTGPLHAHPLFGRLSRKEWDRLQCFHCAHHLSFVEHPPRAATFTSRAPG